MSHRVPASTRLPRMSKQTSISVAVLVALGAAASSLLLRPTPALACSCSRPGVEVSPGAAVAAPTNTVIRVSWWVGEVKVDESTLQIVPAGADAAKAKASKKKGKDAPPPITAIEVD